MKLIAFLFIFILAAQLSQGANPRVAIDTSMGKIVVELYADKAPKTVKNFMTYVTESYYDGTIFHRVIPGFMIQGGGYTADFTKKETHAPVVNEASNGLSNVRGTLAMARTADPNSATSQFFINVVDNASKGLDKSAGSAGYCVFGKVISGMDVVDKIAAVRTGAAGPFSQDCPVTAVTIKKVTLEKASPTAGK